MLTYNVYFFTPVLFYCHMEFEHTHTHKVTIYYFEVFLYMSIHITLTFDIHLFQQCTTAVANIQTQERQTIHIHSHSFLTLSISLFHSTVMSVLPYSHILHFIAWRMYHYVIVCRGGNENIAIKFCLNKILPLCLFLWIHDAHCCVHKCLPCDPIFSQLTFSSHISLTPVLILLFHLKATSPKWFILFKIFQL